LLITPPLQDMMNYLPEGVFVVDERGVMLFVNHAFSEMVGYESDRLVGLNILTLLADVDDSSITTDRSSAPSKASG